MQAVAIRPPQTLWHSGRRPGVATDREDLARVIAWADDNPHVWDIVTQTRSRAFGLGSCAYIGWAQRGHAPSAVLERARHLHNLVTGRGRRVGPGHITVWRARFAFQHYRYPGFTGGLFRKHDGAHPRLCLTLDYTPDTLEEVIDRFLRWCGRDYDTRRVTLDGVAVREIGGRHG